MNKSLVIILLLLLPAFTGAADVDLDNYYSSAKIVYKGDQWYQQDFTAEKLTYMADVVTRQCYFIDRRWNAVLNIDCEDLIRRKEWIKILTWIKPK
jgi:hypothetical protein